MERAPLALIAVLFSLLPACSAATGPDLRAGAGPQIPATPTADPLPEGGAVAVNAAPAAEVGLRILKAGGSAFDSAVAMALVIGVIAPESSGLGGGGFAVFRDGEGVFRSLDFREMAPSFFTADLYVSGERDSRRGPWAVGIPGEAAGLAALHRIGGRLPWRDVVEPARRLAAEGFPLSEDSASVLARRAEQVLADPGLRADFAPRGRPLKAGEICVRRALGETLAYLQVHGGDALYHGPLALSLSGFLAGAGLPWTIEELAAYKVIERPVVEGTYHGHRILSMGPPSSGGVTLLEALAQLERGSPKGREFGSVSWLRSLTHALTHGFADRAAYGADPDFHEVPVARILDRSLQDALFAANPERGPIPRAEAGLAGKEGLAAELLPPDHGTAHLSVIDGSGMAVALTTTVNLDLGALMADPGTGIVLNDQMDDFAARAGQPNAFGLVQSARNAPAPGKRPLSSMSPTLVADAEGRVIAAVGGAGGPTIITGTLQVILGLLDRGLSAKEAVAAPRIHHQWSPPQIFFEEGIPKESRDALSAEGFVFEQRGHIAVVQAATFDPATGLWDGAGDPRRATGALVWQP